MEATVWERRELFQRYQQQRVLALTLGDVFFEIARAYVWNTRVGGGPNLRAAGRAAGMLVKACDHYAAAGMRRQAAVAWRYARLLKAAASRDQA